MIRGFHCIIILRCRRTLPGLSFRFFNDIFETALKSLVL